SRSLGPVVVAAVPRADLRHRAVCWSGPLPVPRDRSAVLERHARHARVHGGVGDARARPRTRDRARTAWSAVRPAHRALAAAAGVGVAVGGDGEAVRMALPPVRGPRELPARRTRAQLAR